MLILLSPAKSLDYESRLPTRKHSEPRLLEHSVELIDVMRGKSVAEIAELMSISPELADLNARRYAEFEAPFRGYLPDVIVQRYRVRTRLAPPPPLAVADLVDDDAENPGAQG